MRALTAALALSLLALGGCATVPDKADPAYPEASSYDPDIDAMAAVDAALARATQRGTRALVVLGANWCHDSRALAGWLDTPRFQQLIAERYELVFIDVGMPQTGNGRNLDIAQRFGLESVEGTPTVLILSAEGRLLNPDTAASWRNASTRSEEAIYAELAAAGE